MKGLCSFFNSAAGIVKRNLVFTVCVFSLFTVPDYTFAGTWEQSTHENIKIQETYGNYKVTDNVKIDGILWMWLVPADQPPLLTAGKANSQYLYHIAEFQSNPEYINPYAVRPGQETADTDKALIRTWPINARESTSLLLFGIGLLGFARWSKKKNRQENTYYSIVIKAISLKWERLSCSLFRGKKLRTIDCARTSDVYKNPGA